MLINWLHSNQPSEILLSIGSVAIHWYGFLMTLAVIIGFIIARFLFKQLGISKNHLIDLGFYLVIFGLLGARLAHVIVELPFYLENPGQIFAFWHGGLAIHGAVITGALVLYFYVKKNQNSLFPDQIKLSIKFFRLADILVLPLLLGQAIGRWGNYFNQELYGLPTNLPWGIPIETANRVPGYESFTHFHPTFLYESLSNLVLFLILFYLINNRHKLKLSILKQPGIIFSFYLLGYSVIRLLTEVLRIDRMPLIADIRLAVIISGLLIIVALWLMWYIYKQQRQRV